MKKLLTSLLLSLIAISAHAANKHPLPSAGDKCDKTGEIAITTKGFNLFCGTKGVWQNESKTANIIVNVLITKGEAVLYNGSITTLDGQPQAAGVHNQITYISQVTQTDNPSTINVTPGHITSGVNITIAPTLEENKKIKTNIAISIDDLISMRNVAVNDDINVQAPEVNSIKYNQIITLDQNTPATSTIGEYAVKVSAKVI